MRVALLLAAGSLELAWTLAVPSANPQGVPNQLWSWRGQQIRYQAFGDPAAKQSVLLVHGLFVNADHWRRNVPALAESGYRVYSIDLLGYGYSSKPDPYGEVARGLSGEKGRALTDVDTELWSPLSPGGTRMASVAQGHPLGSCYNFFTWAEQLCDFVDEVVHKEEDGQHDGQQDGRQDGRQQGVAQSSVALVCNSIGTISGLQAAVDRPELFNGVAVVNPNFRELHVAEQPAPLRPITTAVQSLLRRYGKPLFDALAKPATVKQILREPYSDATQVTDELVDVLLTPLLTEGSAEVMRPLLALLLLQRAEALHQVRWAGTGLRRQGIPLQTLVQSRSRPLRLVTKEPAPSTRDLLAARDGTHHEKDEVGSKPARGVAAAGALASSAIIAEGVQIAGTAVLFYLAQQWTAASSPVEAVGMMIEYLQGLGATGYAVFGALMIFLQVVPIAAAFVLTVSAGAIFGVVKGTAIVSTCSTISASISFLIARSLGRNALLNAARESPQYLAIDTAFSKASFGTALTLITLLRLSPVLPFAWANYVFGLSGVPFAAYSLGTFLGCLPAVAAYVSAGQLGAEIAVNGGETNPVLVVVGIAATLAAITVAGRVANDALKDMDLDLEKTMEQ